MVLCCAIPMTPSPDHLDPLLKKWGQTPPVVPPLSGEIWQRIAAAQAAPSTPDWRTSVGTAFARPSFAAAFIAACILLGMFLAEVRVTQLHHDRDLQLLQSYLQLIDPLVSAPTEPSQETRS